MYVNSVNQRSNLYDSAETSADQTAHYKLNGVGDATKLKHPEFAFGYQGSVYECVLVLMSWKQRNRIVL